MDKDASRGSRLSLKNLAEHTLRSELKQISIERCRDLVDAFGECGRKQGLMVVFSCRSQLKAMNDCVGKHNSEEEWEKFKQQNEEELKLRASREKKKDGEGKYLK